MKIEELIEIYQKLLPIYKNDKEKNYYGLCYNAKHFCDTLLYFLFSKEGYYQNYITRESYLEGPKPSSKEGNLFRIDFMKKEIIELKKLLKEGYTDV